MTGSGLLKSPLKEIVIPLAELDTVTFKTSLLGASLTIRTRNMHRLQEVPGSRQRQIMLGIARKDRDTARRFVSTLNLYQSESVLAQVESQLELQLESQLEASATPDKVMWQEPSLPPPLPPPPPQRHDI